ncbi:MAG: ribosome-associated translation inhibitor RaiA [Acidobacteria bacterium]|nr:ribosome-associated translation inhibitor RaiA [Acidobacteriota bacterium]MBI3656584.1 ribosome-associated translation inhibitor RaiA [Acidobacteriota bacterium]
MKIEITGRHFDITAPIRNFIMVRMKKIPRVIGDQVAVHIILSVEKHRHVAEVVFSSKVGKVTCIEQTHDMYTSIGKALEKIERQALKLKQKRIAVKRNKIPTKTVAAAVAGNSERVDSAGKGRVILKDVSKKPMALEEAMLNLGQSEDNFIVFRDAQSQLVNVLYKRKDGSYGLICPEG